MIDARAVIDSSAELDSSVSVGPYAVIGADVRIGAGTMVESHCRIDGPTEIGVDNHLYSFAAIGGDPQDKKYRPGEQSSLSIGNRNVIREYCTINRGTSANSGGATLIGDDNWIMAYVHIAHDCVIENHTVFANNASLAGHVTVEDYAILGGFTLVHQFCRFGRLAFSGMGSAIAKDVPPFTMVSGNPARAHGLNSEGLKRQGIEGDAMGVLKQAYRILFRSGLTMEDARGRLQALARESGEIGHLCRFLELQTRGIVR